MPWTPDGPNLVIAGDNLTVTATLPDESFRLVYLDPPFNTGRTRTRTEWRTQLLDTDQIPIGFRRWIP